MSAGGWILRGAVIFSIFSGLYSVAAFEPSLITQIGSTLFPWQSNLTIRELMVYGIFFGIGTIVAVLAEWSIVHSHMEDV